MEGVLIQQIVIHLIGYNLRHLIHQEHANNHEQTRKYSVPQHDNARGYLRVLKLNVSIVLRLSCLHIATKRKLEACKKYTYITRHHVRQYIRDLSVPGNPDPLNSPKLLKETCKNNQTGNG